MINFRYNEEKNLNRFSDENEMEDKEGYIEDEGQHYPDDGDDQEIIGEIGEHDQQEQLDNMEQ